jgi:hypothetical protein
MCILLVFLTYMYHNERFRECKLQMNNMTTACGLTNSSLTVRISFVKRKLSNTVPHRTAGRIPVVLQDCSVDW